MQLYTKDGKVCNYDDYDNYTTLGSGIYGSVYKTHDNKCLKVFKENAFKDEDIVFDESVYEDIRRLNLRGFYRLYDLYYNKNLSEVMGYLSDYYEKEDINILTMPTDYTLSNLYTLYDSFCALSRKGIYTEDLHPDNVIMDSNKITIIDIDLFYRGKKKNMSHVLMCNVRNLTDLFSWIYMSSIEGGNFRDRGKMINKIQNLFYVNGKHGVDPVIKRLIKYKYPIDYLKGK